MSKNRESAAIENSGDNSGAIIGINNGTVTVLQTPKKVSSLISTLVKELGNTCELNEEDGSFDSLELIAFKPDDKIEYNCVIKYKEIIKEFSMFFTYCDNAFNIFDDYNIGAKNKILRCIKTWYLESKGQLLLEQRESSQSELEIIRNNADKLIDEVKEKVEGVLDFTHDFEGSSIEEISLGITIIICYCFMKCNILEKPI